MSREQGSSERSGNLEVQFLKVYRIIFLSQLRKISLAFWLRWKEENGGRKEEWKVTAAFLEQQLFGSNWSSEWSSRSRDESEKLLLRMKIEAVIDVFFDLHDAVSIQESLIAVEPKIKAKMTRLFVRGFEIFWSERNRLKKTMTTKRTISLYLSNLFSIQSDVISQSVILIQKMMRRRLTVTCVESILQRRWLIHVHLLQFHLSVYLKFWEKALVSL